MLALIILVLVTILISVFAVLTIKNVHFYNAREERNSEYKNDCTLADYEFFRK